MAIVFAIAAIWHALWAVTIPVPEDWDAQFYALVARNVVDGRGPVTLGLWNLSYLPEKLPAPITHWMPLPAYALVPGLSLWDHGDQATTVVLAALWAPLAYAIARRIGRPEAECLAAGLFAGVVHGYTRVCSTPDTYAIYGVLGGIATLAVCGAERSPIGDLMAFLMSLTRQDGPLFGLSLALSGEWRHRPAMALSAIVPVGLWTLHRYVHLGPAYLDARRLAFETGSYLDFYDGVLRDPVGPWDRVRAVGESASVLLEGWTMPGAALLTIPAVVGVRLLWDRGWTRSVVAFAVLGPIVAIVTAPAIASHGTIPRMLAAIVPVHAAWAAVGLSRMAGWAAEKRGYPLAFTWGSIAGGALVVAGALGAVRVATAAPVPGCPEIPGSGPVFTSDPLAYELVCHRPGVMITRTLPADRAAAVARRYGIRTAVPSPRGDEGSLQAGNVPRVLPGWTDQGGWWRAP